MLTDTLKCDDCLQRGCDCECPKYKGPSWSIERITYEKERAAYEALQWWNKLEFWEPILLAAWQGAGRFVPTYDQALTFKMERNPNPCFVN